MKMKHTLVFLLVSALALTATAAAATAADGDGDFKPLTSRIREKALDLREHFFKKSHDNNNEGVDDGASPPTPFQHSAGYFKLNRTSAAEMFYFYFKSRGEPSTDPVVLWMTGGPGCSR